mmetsp:Transcript_24319/g.78423  ORF Transcript_24319/g.78423 Transcript_24319/m.78423 type:complete len:204 (-) Transcript_24319:557-1168(-)
MAGIPIGDRETASTFDSRILSSCISASTACRLLASSIRSPPMRKISRPHSFTLSSSDATALTPPPDRAVSRSTASVTSVTRLPRSACRRDTSSSRDLRRFRSCNNAVSSSLILKMVSPAAAISSSVAVARCRSARTASRFDSSAIRTSMSNLNATNSCSVRRRTSECSSAVDWPSPIRSKSSLRIEPSELSSRWTVCSPPALN